MLPGLVGGDHIGVTVPDLDEAEDFLVGVLGARHIYTLAGKSGRSGDEEWMLRQIGVHPRTTIREVRFYRLGAGLNIETFKYDPADGQAPWPRNSDLGAIHLALYVEDMDAAVAYLKDKGVDVMGEPVTSAQAAEGQRWQYFRAPFGMQFELVSYPDGKAYEDSAAMKLWDPRRPAE